MKPGCKGWNPGQVLILSAILVLTGCVDPSQPEPAGTTGVTAAVDVEQRLESLLEQDERFAEMAYKEGVPEAYRRFMAVDAVQLPDGGLPLSGRSVIYEELLALTEGMDFSLTWETVGAEVARSGELGYTWGIYYYESFDELGAPYVAEGKYVYLWQYNAGRWELILDITNQTEPDYQDYEQWLEEEYSEEAAGEADMPQGPESLPE